MSNRTFLVVALLAAMSGIPAAAMAADAPVTCLTELTTFRQAAWFDAKLADCDAVLATGKLSGEGLVGVHLARADVMIARGSLQEAAQAYGAALAVDCPKCSRETLLSRRGQILFEAGSFDLAIADFSEAIRLEPKRPMNYFWRASAHLKKDDEAKAFADAAAMVAAAPGDPSAYVMSAIVHEMRSDVLRGRKTIGRIQYEGRGIPGERS